MNTPKIVIVGGVAGGASCAARSRRLSEEAEIIMIERGPFVSFANCGLPYHVGEVIKEEEDLLVASPELFRDRFAIDVRIQCEVTKIDRENKTVTIRSMTTGETYDETYDYLVLSPGAAPLRPPLEGIDHPAVFTVRNIPDIRAIKEMTGNGQAKSAVVVGGGFIGLEMAENLHHIGMQVSVIEMAEHVMPVLDKEMATMVNEHLDSMRVDLYLGSAVQSFENGPDDKPLVNLASGEQIAADIVIMAIGVRPETGLAKAAGLDLGPRGGIAVDGFMHTNDPNIFAVGDAVEVEGYVMGGKRLIPLAGPANRQGRLVADVILNPDKPKPFRGVQGTAVCGVLGMTVASTGETEKSLGLMARDGKVIEYEKVYSHPFSNATYYPGAQQMSFKLIFAKEDGRVLGAQAVGLAGVEKRIDVVAMAIQMGATVYDLEEAELCYAPQYGSAKDPVNMAGMIAANVLKGVSKIVHWPELENFDGILIDVRDPEEYATGFAEGAINMPLDSLRKNLDSLPKDKEIWAYCYVSQRAYFAERILTQHGYNAKTVSGGILSYWAADADA
ncbi:NADPH-dependent 2,4-dienoyl-CoA reductase, sulfur reductase [Desulfatibacillum alkenivorans DSM 16219]|jgi:NADPH-dependent 2,4-dienoyl-CoA reductase/sulfur reductase-like enzyme/rhodanese-related sulfurtransferase|uniref:NADPH-dependent 2,4-dienoyl-CoA reductase, sulfur reductase n=1 Tax=Desulfatibacillum alkenivorans DSM 16219 TaxID=1121393 RepID=A0A1M6IV45_9BACT|nr:FAD-dependent oxidoreductase [Desulfatibacillum alkenivorans]SHJ38335.1 NADPH-dependent 2,4-dienoyl-CoA reductase, sulfur reductase [Desulfatibacillum alkenivorans DSM 16219]